MMSTSAPVGRVAVVTGANKGIGYFVALQLGMSGLFEYLVLGCRDEKRGQEALASMTLLLPPTVKASCVPLAIGDHKSHVAFKEKMDQLFDGSVDVLVNNAGTAFKGNDPTPFAEQTKPTLDVNYRGTVDFTQEMLPLLRKAGKKTGNARIVTVASMSGKLSQVSRDLQEKFSSPSLTIPELNQLMDEFEADVKAGNHASKGWSNTNYGMSKLGVIAATKVLAREEAQNGIFVNCCCPGYCDTDMTSHKGPRSPEEGAKNAVLPATMENPPQGEFFSDFKIGQW